MIPHINEKHETWLSVTSRVAHILW